MQASNVLRRFIPLGDRVLLMRVAKQAKTAGGIILPEAAQPKINEVYTLCTTLF